MTNEELRKKQFYFTWMVAELILFAKYNGYTLSFGDAWSTPDTYQVQEDGSLKRPHIVDSFHYKRLAVDFNLFKDGKWLTKTDDHKKLGEFWESLGGTWGGRFSKPDGNHYSLGE